MEDVNTAIRTLVRTVMGMDANSVRPANQLAPAGGQTQEIATVKIVSAVDAGWAAAGQVDAGDGTSTATVDTITKVTASIQFFRAPPSKKDPTGAAAFSLAAFDRARRLGARLQLPASVDLMNSLGIGLLEIGQARDLAAVNDGTWESRGQIDVTFDFSSTESEAVQTVIEADINLEFQPPGNVPLQTRTIEVTT